MNRIDELMLRIEEDPSLASPGDIDEVIKLQRQARSNHELGIKPSKGDGPKIEASDLLKKIGMAPAPVKINRRI